MNRPTCAVEIYRVISLRIRGEFKILCKQKQYLNLIYLAPSLLMKNNAILLCHQHGLNYNQTAHTPSWQTIQDSKTCKKKQTSAGGMRPLGKTELDSHFVTRSPGFKPWLKPLPTFHLCRRHQCRRGGHTVHCALLLPTGHEGRCSKKKMFKGAKVLYFLQTTINIIFRKSLKRKHLKVSAQLWLRKKHFFLFIYFCNDLYIHLSM